MLTLDMINSRIREYNIKFLFSLVILIALVANYIFVKQEHGQFFSIIFGANLILAIWVMTRVFTSLEVTLKQKSDYLRFEEFVRANNQQEHSQTPDDLSW